MKPSLHTPTLTCLLAFSLVATSAHAQSAPSSAEHDAYLWSLGEHFRTTRAYYRAVSVFEELAFVTRDDATRFRARLGVALAYHLGGQYRDALIEYDDLLDHGVAPVLEAPLLLQRDVAAFEAFVADNRRGSADHFAAQIEPLQKRDPDTALFARYHATRIRLYDGQLDTARTSLGALQAACKTSSHTVCANVAELTAALDSPRARTRAPWLGVLLSALVPGLGSAYSEHYLDGAYYLVLTGAPLLLAANVYDDRASFGNQRAAIYVLGGLSAVTYLAALISGYVTALRFNDTESHRFRKHVLDVTQSPLPLAASGER